MQLICVYFFARNSVVKMIILLGTVGKHKKFDKISTTPAQRLGRSADIVQMLWKCFVFAGWGREG